MSEKTFADVLRELAKPFSTKAVQWRPGATNKDKTRAQALAYVDLREYQDRLDKVAPGAWEVRVEPLGEAGVLKVSLTILGVTREDVGEASPEDDNTYTSAFAQGFKRACAAFGLGRYLYWLPKVWCAYDAQRRALLETPVLPKWAVPEDERTAYFAARGGWHTVPNENATPTPNTSNGAKVNGNGAKPTANRPTANQPNGNGKGQDPAMVVIKFGKHRGKTLGQILAEDKGYLQWLAENSNNKFIASKARQLLDAQPQAEPEPKPEPEPQAQAEPQEPDQPDPFDDIPF